METAKTIEGRHDPATGRTTVTVDGDPIPLSPSLALSNHSPTGFSWGYGGSGPAQLALALLLAFGATPAEALRLHQRLKRDLIAPLAPHQAFTLPACEVADWLERERAAARLRATERAHQCFARLQPPIEAALSYDQLLDPEYAHHDAPRARLEFISTWPEHACIVWGPHACLALLACADEHGEDSASARRTLSTALQRLTHTVLGEFLPTPALQRASPYPAQGAGP